MYTIWIYYIVMTVCPELYWNQQRWSRATLWSYGLSVKAPQTLVLSLFGHDKNRLKQSRLLILGLVEWIGILIFRLNYTL